MPFDIGALGQGIAGTAGGAILGLALGGINDERQYNQAQKLQQLQIQGQEQLTNYNANTQFEQWLRTNAPAQVGQYEAAGLNPALMYGGGGGGGTTINSISPGSTTGQSAPVGGQEAMKGAELGMGMQLQQAQVKVLESQANLNNTEATNKGKGGVVNTNIQANTELTQQQLDNARQAFDNQQLQNTMQNILNFEQQASQGDRLQYIAQQAKQAQSQTQIIANTKNIQSATVDDQIKIIKQQAIEAVLKNSAIQSNIQVNDQQIKTMYNQILINWDTLSNEQKKTTLQQEQMQGIFKDTNQQYFDNVIKTIDAISIMKGKNAVVTP